MASVIPIVHGLYFILVNIIFINFAKSEFTTTDNATGHTLWRSDRSKRHLDELPRMLEITVKYLTDEEIHLQWIMADGYLANEHLPVLTTANIRPDTMQNIGGFVVYHDVQKTSAVVYFVELQRLFGVIGLEYYIRGLPFHFDKNGKYTNGIAGAPFIAKRVTKLNHFPTISVPTKPSWKRPSDGDPGPSTKRQHTEFEQPIMKHGTNSNQREVILNRQRRYVPRSKDFYLETMVIVTHDVVKLFKSHYGEGKYIEWIVRNHIIYFNAVDMIFQKLRYCKIKFRMNIARILIEDETVPFPFRTSNGNLKFNDVMKMLPGYLRIHRFEQDSFDYVFMHASGATMEDFTVNGLTKYGADLYEARKNDQFYEAVPISVVGYEYVYADYLVAVREISRVLNVDIDSQPETFRSAWLYQSMMQDEPNSFIWNTNHREQFKKFFSENRNRCFLLNQPWSLHSRGAFRKLTPNLQCQCYGYHSYILNNQDNAIRAVKSDECNQPLSCLNVVENVQQFELTILPFDGTPCARTKVCWNSRCVHI